MDQTCLCWPVRVMGLRALLQVLKTQWEAGCSCSELKLFYCEIATGKLEKEQMIESTAIEKLVHQSTDWLSACTMAKWLKRVSTPCGNRINLNLMTLTKLSSYPLSHKFVSLC